MFSQRTGRRRARAGRRAWCRCVQLPVLHYSRRGHAPRRVAVLATRAPHTLGLAGVPAIHQDREGGHERGRGCGKGLIASALAVVAGLPTCCRTSWLHNNEWVTLLRAERRPGSNYYARRATLWHCSLTAAPLRTRAPGGTASTGFWRGPRPAQAPPPARAPGRGTRGAHEHTHATARAWAPPPLTREPRGPCLFPAHTPSHTTPRLRAPPTALRCFSMTAGAAQMTCCPFWYCIMPSCCSVLCTSSVLMAVRWLSSCDAPVCAGQRGQQGAGRQAPGATPAFGGRARGGSHDVNHIPHEPALQRCSPAAPGPRAAASAAPRAPTLMDMASTVSSPCFTTDHTIPW